MAKFKIGDVVELVDKSCMNAPIGSLATVIDIPPFHGYGPYVSVHWHPGAHNQADGGYDEYRFVLREPVMEDTREYLEAVTM